ncbi:unnamed protein product [Chrysoparadoxa australica]
MSMADRDDATKAVIEGLKKLYHSKLKPLEQLYMFDFFHSPLLTDSEFDSKPQVLMIGQYSTGKTSFIRYLLGRDFPGQRIGPEPTTDRFVAVMDGPEERVIPGNALTVSPNLPYRGLDRFGTRYAMHLLAQPSHTGRSALFFLKPGSMLPSPVLRNITIIDTPGVLSGEKQRLARGYDFVTVNTWFAERADLVLLLFDAHKLDISDEFRAVIEKLRGHDDKVRCILNKADTVDRQKLMRVYGALMWSIGKIIKTPEVLRVYVGSFWDEPLVYDDNTALFDMEERDLMNDLRELPRNSAVRKINELVKRCRLAKVHAYVIGYLRAQMPQMMGKEKTQRKLMQDMGGVFRTVMKQYNLAPGDFPDIEQFKSKCSEMNFSKFPKLRPKMLQDLDEVLSQDIPRLMEMLPRSVVSTSADKEMTAYISQASGSPGSGTVRNIPNVPVPGDSTRDLNGSGAVGINSSHLPISRAPSHQRCLSLISVTANGKDSNPFGESPISPTGPPWALEMEMSECRGEFESHNPVGGKLSAQSARVPLMNSGLPNDSLRIVWDLSDMDSDGMLDLEEFTVAMHLCSLAKGGAPLPEQLPQEVIPMSKRPFMLHM